MYIINKVKTNIFGCWYYHTKISLSVFMIPGMADVHVQHTAVGSLPVSSHTEAMERQDC